MRGLVVSESLVVGPSIGCWGTSCGECIGCAKLRVHPGATVPAEEVQERTHVFMPLSPWLQDPSDGFRAGLPRPAVAGDVAGS